MIKNIIYLLAILKLIDAQAVQVQQTLPTIQVPPGISLIPPSTQTTTNPVTDLRYILRQQQQQPYQILTQNPSLIQLQSQGLSNISPQLGYGSDLFANRLSSTMYRPPIQLSGFDIASGLMPSGQPQTLQLPCVLTLQAPVPISLAPGASQVTVSDSINFQTTIPASHIDDSLLVPVLRPPSSDAVAGGLGVGVRKTIYNPVNPSQIYSHLGTNLVNSSPIAAITTTTITEKELGKARSEYDSEMNTQAQPPVKEGRQGYPMIVYAILSPQHQLLTPSSAFPVQAQLQLPSSVNVKRNQEKQRQQQNRNPFFNVNKRKHFEHYEYF